VKGAGVRVLLYAALVVAYLLHNDLWLWTDTRTVFALPVGLTYHVVYCLVVAALMALLVRFAWPTDLETGAEEPTGR